MMVTPRGRRALTSKFFTVLAVLLVAAGGVIIGAYAFTGGRPTGTRISPGAGATPLPTVTVTLNLTVTDPGGHVVGQRVVHDDLILDNFNKWLQGVLTPYTGSWPSFTLTNTANSGLTYASGCGISNCYSCSANPIMWTAICNSVPSGGEMFVGTGTKTVLRTVYVLNTPYQSPFFAVTSACNNAAPPTVVVQGSTNAGSGATLTEAAFALKLEASANNYDYLFTYETFSGVPVAGGDLISVQYTFTLNNNGVNRNLCNSIAAWFLATNTGGNTYNMYDTAGNGPWVTCAYIISGTGTTNCTYTNSGFCCGGVPYFSLYVNNGASNSVTGQSGVSPGTAIWLGTGAPTYGFTSLALANPVGASPSGVSATTYQSGLQTSYVFVTENSFNPASTTSVTELGLFAQSSVQVNSGSFVTYRFLMFGTSFSAVSCTASSVCPFSVQVSD